MTALFVYTDPPANIIDQPQNQSTFISLSPTFHCNATSLYPVTYSWRRINSSLTIRDRTNTSSLVISSVRRSDEGWYQCVASVFGVESFSAPAYLTVKGMYGIRQSFGESVQKWVWPQKFW